MQPHYKPISFDESNLFKAAGIQKFEYPWHYHPEYQLTYVVASRGVQYVGNSVENYFDDDLVLIGPNLPHCWINTTNQQQQASAIVVYLKKEFLDKAWIQSYEFEAIRKLLSLSNKGIKFDKAVALKVKLKYFELLKLPPLERLMLLLQILQELAQATEYHFLCEQGFSYQLNHCHNERINMVNRYVERHYQQKISLADMAALVNMSEEYFSRFFSKVMKKPFFEFLNEYKINRACKLLIETSKQISEICYTSGFESIPFFYRQFKKFKNCQPKNYRENYQKILS